MKDWQEKRRKNPEQLESWRYCLIIIGHVLKRKDLTSNSRNFLYRRPQHIYLVEFFSLGHFFLPSLAAVHIIELLNLAVNARKLNLFKYLEMNDFSGTNLNAYQPIASYFHY